MNSAQKITDKGSAAVAITTNGTKVSVDKRMLIAG